MKKLTFNLDTESTTPSSVEDVSQTATIKTGICASGWMKYLPYLGENVNGMWDLGKGGSIQILTPSSDITVATVVYYADSMLYSTGPDVTLDGKSAMITTETSEPIPGNRVGGKWTARKYTWATPQSHASLNLIVASPVAMPMDSIIDSIIVDVQDKVENSASTVFDSIKTAVDTLNKVISDLQNIK